MNQPQTDEILHSLTDTFLVFDQELRCTFCNSAALSLTTCTMPETLGKCPSELLPPILSGVVEKCCRQSIQALKPQQLQIGSAVANAPGYSVTIFPSRHGAAVIIRPGTTAQQRHEGLLDLEQLIQTDILGIIIADELGHIPRANKAFLEMVGYAPSDLPLRWDHMTPQEWHGIDSQGIARLKKHGSVTPWEKEFFRKDGSRVPVLLGVASMDVARFSAVCFIVDLSERKEIERRLKEREAFLNTLLSFVPVAVFQTDMRGNYLYVNEHWCRMTGLPPEEARGDGWSAALHPDDREEIIGRRQRQLTNRKPWSVEGRLIHRHSGEVTWVYGQTTLVRDNQGNLLGYVGAHTDVTALKKARLELEQARNQWDATFESIDVAICILEKNRTVNKCNAAMQKVIGKPLEEIIGRCICELMHARAAIPDTCPFRRMLESGHREAQQLRLGERWAQETVFPIFSADRELTGAVYSYVDITLAKQAEEELSRKNIALSELVAQIENEKNRLKDNIAINIRELIQPQISKLRLGGSNKEQLDSLEKCLLDLCSSFGREICAERPSRLSPKEIEICTMIRAGLGTKEIARSLGTSIRTVETQRKVIRKKLGLSNRSANLTAFLQNMA